MRPEGRAAYEAQTSTFLTNHQMSEIQPGHQIMIHYDRHHPEQVAVESRSEPSGIEGISDLLKSIDIGRLLTERLAAGGGTFRALEQPTALERLAQARILSSSGQVIGHDGTAGLIRFELEVAPAGQASFSASIQDMISTGSIAKYQPGSTVWVRYDPATPSCLAFDRS